MKSCFRCSWPAMFSSIQEQRCYNLLDRHWEVRTTYHHHCWWLLYRYGRSTASSQYLLQLAGYLGIPVIAWNADNSGLERVIILHKIYWDFQVRDLQRTFHSTQQSIGMLQLAPSIDHQISAMFSILQRWVPITDISCVLCLYNSFKLK